MITSACRVSAFLAAAFFTLSLGAAPPQIAQFNPLALAPGKITELSLRGQNLQDPRALWTTFAARCEFVPADGESQQKGETLICRVTVPRGEQVGIGALRLVTGEGVSNPVLVMLDDLPTIAEPVSNHTVSEAQSVQWPIAIDGQCDPIQEDMFRFYAAAGQRLSFEVVSQRLGSKLDPLVRLLSADGKEIAKLDDSQGAGGDSRFTHTFESDGEYLLALRDVRHAGGNDYRYRLRVGTFPLITAAYPAGGRSGEVVSFELLGANVAPLSPLHVVLAAMSATEAPRLTPLCVNSGESGGAGWFQVEAQSGPESLEQEPNDGSAEATAIVVPGTTNGRLDKVDDRDYFKFMATKGQRVRFGAKTRELGSACDLYMSLQKGDGAQLAEARQDRETVLTTEIPADGEYLLQVENLLVGGEPGHVYRIDVSHDFGGFALSAEQNQYTSPQGGTFVAKVLAQRRGYNGPIELSVEGLGDDLKLEGNRFDGGETLLKVTLPESIKQGAMRPAKIVGTAKVDERDVIVRASQRDPLLAAFPNAPSLPSQLEDAIAIGIGPPFPPFFDLNVAGAEVYFPRIVGASTFDVSIVRSNESFKDPVALVVEGLPAGITADIAPVEDGLKAVRVSLKGPTDLAESETSIRIVGTAKFQEQSRTVALEKLVLRVTQPLVVSATMTGPILAGGQQEAVVKLQRFGDEPQPVRLQIADGPAGVAAPIFVTIPSEANQVTIPLSAAKSAASGRFDNLVVVASTTVKGQNITVRSKPATVEIQPVPAE